MSETWRPIPGFDSYDVSDEGRVRSWYGWRGRKRLTIPRVMKPAAHPVNHYLSVSMTVTGRQIRRNVHVIVMLSFVGPRPEGCDVCHADGDPTNNRLSNLRYDTHVANAADMARHGTRPRGEQHGRRKLTAAQVDEIRARIRTGEARRYVAAAFDVSRSTVDLIAAGKRWGAP